jgi:RHS repeat-associated protein
MAGDEPVGTENVYDSLGRVIETRRWADVEITIEDVNKPGTSQVVGKKSTGWTTEGIAPVAGNELSYTKTLYDIAGRVKMSIVLDEAGYEQPTGYKYDSAGKQLIAADANDYGLSTGDYNTVNDWHVIKQSVLDTICTDTYISALNNTSTTHYEGTRRNSVTDDSNNTTSFTYDALGRLIKTTYPTTPTTYTYIEYDGLGRKLFESEQTSETSPANSIGKSYEYDAAGRLKATVLPEVPFPQNQTVTKYLPRYEYKYDVFGNMLEQWDNIKQSVDGTKDYTAKRVTKFTYNELHQKASCTRQFYLDSTNGTQEKTESWKYDVFGRPQAHIDFKGQKETYTYYDDTGSLRYKKYYDAATDYEQDPNNWTIEFEFQYDKLGRQTTVTEKDKTSGTALTRATNYHYDADGRITQIQTAEGGEINYAYNPCTGQKTSTSNENNLMSTAYGYDELGRLKTATKPITGDTNEVATYGYDVVGNRSSLAVELTGGGNAEFSTAYTYDNLNRLTNVVHTKTVGTGTSLSQFNYTLANNGRRTNVNETIRLKNGTTEETHNIAYGYDALNRLTSEDAGTGSYRTAYEHDLMGNRLTRHVRGSGACMDTAYAYADGTDQLISETHATATCAYRFGDQKYYAYANTGSGGGVYYVNSAGKKIGNFVALIIGLPSAFSRPILIAMLMLIPMILFAPAIRAILYALWYSGQPVRLRVRVPKVGICLMLAFIMLLGPEGVMQLAQAETLYGNIQTSTWAQAGTTVTYEYDANGSVQKKQTKQGETVIETVNYYYDIAGRLWKVNNGTDTFYTYDYNGNRIRCEKDTTRTDYLIDPYNPTGYSQTLEEWSETDDSATSTWYTIGDDVISQTKSHWTLSGSEWLLQITDPTRFLIYDGHGSTRQLVKPDGTIDDTYGYDAYGVMLGGNPTSIPADGTSLLYAGEQFDTSAQHYYLRARYYDPLNGRFNRLDPYDGDSEDPLSLHKYLYCNANPINFVDPEGLFTEKFGYLAEDAIQGVYKIDRSFDNVSYGGWTKLGSPIDKVFRLKPDILNYTKSSWLEIKPLTISGVAKAGIQYKLYDTYLGALKYKPEVNWTPSTHFVYAGTVEIFFFNAGGIVFYTDIYDSAEDLLALTSYQAVKEFMRSPAGLRITRGALGSLSRIPGLVTAGRSADNSRLQGHFNISFVLAGFGVL